MEIVTEYSFKYSIDANLVHAVIKAESKYNADAVSKSGAIGLMQILPQTGKYIAENLGEDFSLEMLKSPNCNIKYGTWYLKYLLKKFHNQNTAIAAYNAGEGNVAHWLTVYSEDGVTLDEIPFGETRKYVEKVNNYYENFKKTYNY